MSFLVHRGTHRESARILRMLFPPPRRFRRCSFYWPAIRADPSRPRCQAPVPLKGWRRSARPLRRGELRMISAFFSLGSPAVFFIWRMPFPISLPDGPRSPDIFSCSAPNNRARRASQNRTWPAPLYISNDKPDFTTAGPGRQPVCCDGCTVPAEGGRGGPPLRKKSAGGATWGPRIPTI